MFNIVVAFMNLIVLAGVVAFGMFVKWMGVEFALGGLFGMFLAFLGIRLRYGRWL